MTGILLPVGHCLGTFHDAATGRPGQRVRVGADVVTLDDVRFGVWGLAHGVPDRPAETPWTTERLVESAAELGLAGAEEALAALLADGLVVEVTPGTASAEAFARGHRLLPLLVGLGNTGEQPDVYRIGLPGQPLLAVDAVLYDLYEWAGLESDLWTACESAADINRRTRPDDAVATDPTRLLGALLTAVHALLGPNAVCLDTRLPV